MSLALVCMSHSPLFSAGEPPDEIRADVEAAVSVAREFVDEYDPELVVAFAPDHYNGFFYELMPQFCIGLAACGVGDFGSDTTPYRVPAEAAELAEAVITAGVDASVSLQMQVDHGAVQPLELLFGSVAAKPVIPVFVNSVAPPFAPMQRVRLLGEAAGRYLTTLDKRVLLIGSGGLSHDPPVPQLNTATEQQRALLLNGRNPSPEVRAQREQRVKAAAVAFAAGEADIQDLNPEWDRAFLQVCASGVTRRFDDYRAADMTEAAGHSVHEVRTWVAAYSALSTAGAYRVTSSYYRPILELIAGFAVTTARPVT
ncbi:2,3-dihydroxyphenylpropionate 1,2-dioxygenase [Kibdelosporangium banguiense]|uniref:2,3-dihydroxyphenylpropionate/2,3-dihydroxicinnamic acid 1,2-dioxygenase n=1 Tax=Kibdelosporangium banguiense TaxID=1365924 RepID=A0ABS4TXW9_9PSEU|nr:3-carboxyethylcatechol 2,3-dioxygenase [Kibdelosporangium banguiense]MBP2329224.1 2,3-dihydroxyphenylpropionate 1,2-dioxygenase [Kibdelosporangium banguiense]